MLQIRTTVRVVLVAVDLLLFMLAVVVAMHLGNLELLAAHQLLVLAVVLWAASLIAQPRGETARTFDVDDALRLSFGAVLGTVAALLFEFIPSPLTHASIRLIVISAVLAFVFRIGARVAIVLVRRAILRRRPDAARTIVVGAGRAAASVIAAIHDNTTLRHRIVGCVDDAAHSRSVAGVRVLGGVSDLAALVARHRVECVIVAIPSAPLPFVRRIMDICSGATDSTMRPCQVKVVPGAGEVLNERVTVSRLRDLRIDDVLPRKLVSIDASSVLPQVEGEVVLVTGAGGSIGSELCRQISMFKPKLLLLLGHGENSLFEIEQELRAKFKFTATKMLLADVADMAAIRDIFSRYRPRIVFHAAAHKHVPILEFNICEAVRNNVIGTHVVALAAAAAGVAKFVLLSTDKAVNPTSVMGTTKRMSEQIIQSIGSGTSTEFVAVRFGNVLGSRGSVVPIFRKQLENGGPLTITHRDMTRFFMSIPEAVSLVMEAMAVGRDGQVFVLDMGEPVKIVHLAETIIRLSGLEPYRDIDIVETAIRPGEKLFEEVLTEREGVSRTQYRRLFIAQQERLPYSTIASVVAELQQVVKTRDVARTVAILQECVPSFTYGESFPAAEPRPLPASTPVAFPAPESIGTPVSSNGKTKLKLTTVGTL